MKRTFFLLAATTAMSVSLASPSSAAGEQAHVNSSASVQAEASQDTGFFSSIGRNVKGLFSRDNDHGGRADMANRTGVSASANTSALDQAEAQAEAERAAQTAPAAGTNARVGVGATVDTDLGGGTGTGMGNVGISGGADTTSGARAGGG